ncbi:pseudouridine synthase [Parabacteroides sp.]
MDKLHHFGCPVSQITLPEKFTYPFHYTPHPLSVMAAKEVQAYLHTRKDWESDLEQGKMFGVLIVQTLAGEIGYLAAFSGILAGKNLHEYFVPPVYDLQQPEGFFRIEEDRISAINTRIKELDADTKYTENKQRLADATLQAKQAIENFQTGMETARLKREERRRNNPDEAEQAALIHESQFQKAELKRLKQQWNNRIATIQTETDTFERKIEQLKTERKTRSAALQQQLFEQFRILNNRGEVRDLCDIFKDTAQKVPPAGAGECAAPKLLQYAYLHQLKPIAMAEFWWGRSPKAEIRHHGYFYPACKGKCEPILKHMLQGLEVEDNPLSKDNHSETHLEIVYEDDWLLIVNKPEGMLSVPGKADMDSVYQRLKNRYPEATGPLIVHRLDMATSGLLLAAKTKEVHQNLQAQFKNRTIKKRYIAILDGLITTDKGTISLPLCLDPQDRPRQIVSEEYGKPAITNYLVLERKQNKTRIAFYPLTGRTHQLRVHAAHPQGLNTPILGDELYGKKATRLYLHAEYLEFRHPVSGKTIRIEKKAEF